MPRIMRGVKIRELSLVDRPANQHAHVTIFKRAPEPTAEQGKRIDTIVKAFYGAVPSSDGGTPSGARSFNDLITEREDNQRRNEVDSEFWPLFSALEDSIRSVVADESVPDEAKVPLIRVSVEQFMAAVSAVVPDALAALEKVLKERPATAGFFKKAGEPGENVPAEEISMADETALKAQLTELQGKVTTLTDQLKTSTANVEALTAQVAAEKKRADEAVAAKATVDTELKSLKDAAEVAKTDEVISIADPADSTKRIEVRKSKVGADAWAMFKSQQVAIDKAVENEAVMKYTSRAKAEIGLLPGTDVAKGLVLRAIEAIPHEDTRKAAMTILAAGEAALKRGFMTVGHAGGDQGDSAEGKLNQLAEKRAADDKVTFAQAYDRVLDTAEGKRLYGESLNEKQRAA